jgi:rhodanese-related sulfurtransferase
VTTTPEIQVQDIPELAAIVDVREDDEWAAGHIAEAQHLPLGEVAARVTELPLTQPLYVICRSGKRSAQAVAWLNQQGHAATNIVGGMQAWSAAGRAMVADEGTPTVI